MALLETIHLFVEVLDKYFGNVCELDIVFNFHKAFGILDEMIIGGRLNYLEIYFKYFRRNNGNLKTSDFGCSKELRDS